MSGGEQSGHMIFRDFTTTGVASLSALQVLADQLRRAGKTISELKTLLEYRRSQLEFAVKLKHAVGGVAGVITGG